MDDQWRVLDLGDLGLSEDSWPGADTYGAGSLSGDGRIWTGHARGGVVLVDLVRGRARFADFPSGRSEVSHVGWVPGRDVVSAYVAPSGSRRGMTFHVDNSGQVKAVHYPGWRTRFDVDGTPVEVIGVGRQRLKIKRWQDEGIESRIVVPGVEIPRSMRSYAFGAFGAADVALYVHRGWPSAAPAQVWVLDKRTGAMRARLRVPASSSIIGWAGGVRLRLLIANRRVIEWEPRTGQIRQVLALPGPYPSSGEWAAATVALPSQ